LPGEVVPPSGGMIEAWIRDLGECHDSENIFDIISMRSPTGTPAGLKPRFSASWRIRGTGKFRMTSVWFFVCEHADGTKFDMISNILIRQSADRMTILGGRYAVLVINGDHGKAKTGRKKETCSTPSGLCGMYLSFFTVIGSLVKSTFRNRSSGSS